METILCKNCNYFRQIPGDAYCYNSAAENTLVVDLVYGHRDYYLCKEMRADLNACGIEAKWFSRIGIE